MKLYYTHISQLKSDEHGGIMPIAALVIFFALIGVLALSVDMGLNYKEQSNLDAKLTSCANYAASEYTYYKIRNATGASDRPNDNLVLPESGMSNEAALEKLRVYMQDCVRGSDGELASALVTRAYITYNKEYQAILTFDATTPQSGTFDTSARGKIIAAQSGKLIPFYDPDIPAGTPKPTGIKPTDVSAMVVFPLDYNSKTKLGVSVESFSAAAVRAFSTLNMIGVDSIRAGLQTGNIPSDSPVGISTRGDRSIGWSGGMLESASTSKAGNGRGNAAIIREWPFDAEIYTRDTRRCDATPVWTYDKVLWGYCHTYRQSTISCRDDEDCSGYNLEIENCDNDIQYCYTSNSGSGCAEREDCIPVPPATNCPCLVRESHITLNRKYSGPGNEVWQGKWRVSCPKNAMSTSRIYKTPDNFLQWKAKLVANLDKQPVPANKQIQLEGKMIRAAKELGVHQKDELLALSTEDTDNSWTWACGWRSGGTLYGGSTGEYGYPWGELMGASRSLYNSNMSSTQLLGCNLGVPRANSADAWNIRFSRPTCNNPTSPTTPSKCNIPEGYYQVYVNVQGLKPSTASLANPTPPFTTTPSPDPNGKWAFGGLPGQGGGRGNLQPGGKGDDNVGYTGYGESVAQNDTDRWGDLMCNNANGGTYLEPYIYYQDEPMTFLTNQIPAEYLMISDIAAETHREAEDAGMSPLDTFDVKPPTGEEPFIVDVDSTTLYPYFSIAAGTTIVETPATSAADGKGIAVFSGNVPPLPDQLVGVMPVAAPDSLVGRIMAAGSTVQANSNAISNLETVKRNGTNYGAENRPMAEGAIINALGGLSYAPYNIHTGHGGNWGALLNAAVTRLTLESGPDDIKVLIYIGSCPDGEIGTTPSTKFSGSSGQVNWFATSNAAGGVPGTINADYSLVAPMWTGGMVADTKATFEKVRNQVSYFMVITNESSGCREYTKYATGGGNPPDIIGTAGVAIGGTDGGYTATAADAAAEVLFAISGERQEVRKLGISSD